MNRSTFRVVYFSILLFLSCIANTTWAGAESAASPEFDWRTFLAPFHTVTLHLPIGFVTMAVILEFYSFVQKGEVLRKVITLVLWLSALSGIVVTMLGLFRGGGGGYEGLPWSDMSNRVSP